jgi:hypothetical protein
VGRLLTVPGIDVNVIDQYYRRTPLWEAASHGHEAVVRLLLTTPGIDVNVAEHRSGRRHLGVMR